MKILQAFKFQLKSHTADVTKLRQFAGACRFVWNKALELEKKSFESSGKYLGYNKNAGQLKEWKNQPETAFLSDVHSQILQQKLKDLDRAYKNFFEGRADLPKFKKRGLNDSFRYPQGFKVDENNSRVYLPKIGWISYHKSRLILGTPKQMTISCKCGKWYVSIQTERYVDDPVHPSDQEIGIDMGIKKFAAMSDETSIEPQNSFRSHEKKLAKLQKQLSRKQKFSKNWQKQKLRVQKQHLKIANVRNDFLHKNSTTISKNHALIVMEDLKVSNMSASASGSLEKPGRNVRAKSGLNKAILDQGWYEFRRQIGYKLTWLGGTLLLVPPRNTSLTCNNCGCIDKGNRISQAQFKCVSCGHVDNADFNAAKNILAAGQAVSACGAGRAQASALKQEPACETR